MKFGNTKTSDFACQLRICSALFVGLFSLIDSSSVSAQSCAQIAPNPNLTGNSIVTTGDTCNQQNFLNAGTLTNNGTLTNYSGARIGNNFSGPTNSTAGFLINNGTFDNFGEIGAARIVLPGSLINNGTMNNEASGRIGVYGVSFLNAGTWNNAGTLSMGGSTFRNTGTFNNSGDFSNDIDSISQQSAITGVFNNLQGGTATVLATRWNATITNAGTMGGQFILNSGINWITSTGLTNPSAYQQDAGITRVDGLLATRSSVNILGGELQGNGTITTGNPGNVQSLTLNGGIIAPGNSTGTLSLNGNLSFNSGILQTEISGTGTGQFDLFKVSGNASFLAGTLGFIFAADYVPNIGDHWTFLTADGGINGFSNLNYSFSGGRDYWEFDVSSNNNELTLTVAAIPEPEIYAMMAAGLGFMGFAARRRKQKDVIKA